ncbi:MAG: hypothetical protein ACQSGP_29785 [Frankia sp.]
MLDLLVLRPDLIAPITVHKVLIIGTVVVAIAIACRRFGLATITSVPLIALAGVDEVRPSAAGRAARQFRASGRSVHHAVTMWFIVGVCLVGLFLVFVLVSILTIYRANRPDGSPCYPDQADRAPRAGLATSADLGTPGSAPWPAPGAKRERGYDRQGAATTPRRVPRPAECLPHLRRLSLLTREFLLCVQEGWPVRISLRSEDTRWFLDALLHATGLVVDNRSGLPAAISEAERRWVLICSRSGPDCDSTDGENIPNSDPDQS